MEVHITFFYTFKVHKKAYLIVKDVGFFTMHTLLFILLYFTVDLLFKFLFFNKFDPQTFFFLTCILFVTNSRVVKSNLLTKNQIKRHGPK